MPLSLNMKGVQDTPDPQQHGVNEKVAILMAAWQSIIPAIYRARLKGGPQVA